MADQYNPVLSNSDAQIDCDNDSSSSSNVIKFTHDNGTELMRIQEDGNVGIGSTSPKGPFDVSNNNPKIFLTSTNSDSNARNWLIRTEPVEYGDFAIIQSNAKGSDPLSDGTTRLYISRAWKLNCGKRLGGCGWNQFDGGA